MNNDSKNELSEPEPQNICNVNRTIPFLTNEKVFLAWIRTGLTLMSFGFVVNQFGLALEKFALNLPANAQHIPTGASELIGIGMVIFGGILCFLAAWRYHKVNEQIKRGKIYADHGLVGLVTVLTIILTIVMVIFMFSASIDF